MALELWQLWLILGVAIIGLAIYYVRKSKKLTKRQKEIIEVCLGEARLWLQFYEDKKISLQEATMILKGIARIYKVIAGESILDGFKKLGIEIPVEIFNVI